MLRSTKTSALFAFSFFFVFYNLWKSGRPDSLLLTSWVQNEYQSKTYDPECKWAYEEMEGGYPPVANDGRKDLATYICPSTFRDMADYVYAWPYERFGESQVYIPD